MPGRVLTVASFALSLATSAVVGSAVLRPQERLPRVQFDRPLNAAYRLRLLVTHPQKADGHCCSTLARLQLVDRVRPDRFWDLGRIAEDYEYDYRVPRADSQSAVVCEYGNYGDPGPCTKLFYDVRSKRGLAQVTFDPVQAVAFADDAEAERLLNVPAATLATLRERGVFATTDDRGVPPADALLPRPLPQSTYREFARDRPRRVLDGYGEGINIEETVGAAQQVGDRVWFGKTFYDGEGTSGVGGIGNVGGSGRYSLLRIPELYDWSVSSLYVEGATIWAGRLLRPEGSEASGGLLEYRRATRVAKVHAIPDIIHSIVRVDRRVFLGTDRGLHVLSGDELTWYHMEPDVTGRLVLRADRQ